MDDGMTLMPKPMRRDVVAVLFGVAALALVGGTTTAQAQAVGIFGAVETARKGLKPFPKWTGVLRRNIREIAQIKETTKKKGQCEATLFTKCYYDNWQKLIAYNRNAPPGGQLDSVNRYMNRARYIIDPINWGVRDYWASPLQFFRKDGDCEDYAIAKYLTLRALGWKVESMRIVVLQDLNLKIAHAILSVYYNGKILLLDNQIVQVVDSKTVRHYQPIYSVNENGWWRLRRPR